MYKRGKTSNNAISAISYLAEIYEGGVKVSSKDVAAARDLPVPLVAKLLTTLSQAGFVDGITGPGSGYSLAREPSQISLADVISQFERIEDQLPCPFGPNWCGKHDPCPMHDAVEGFRKQIFDYMSSTTLEIFAKNH